MKQKYSNKCCLAMYFLHEFCLFQYGRFAKIFMPPNDWSLFLSANLTLFWLLLVQSHHGKEISRNGYGPDWGKVLGNVQPVHPNSFKHCNLCELMAQAKLSTFAISMLDKMCDHFEISTSDIKGRKKAPYLCRIEQFLKQCSCYLP